MKIYKLPLIQLQSTSFFLLISYLFFQQIEDGLHYVYFNFPDQVFLLVGVLIIFFGFKKSINQINLFILLLLFSAMTLSLLTNDTFLLIYDDLDNKFQPYIFMTTHFLLSIFLILSIYSQFNHNKDFNLSFGENFFAVISLSFLISFILNFFNLRINYGIDFSYGFPRIQGFMMEPSFAGYVFITLYHFSKKFSSKLIFISCSFLTLSFSVYIGILIYLLFSSQKYFLILLAILTMAITLLEFEFLTNRINELFIFLTTGSYEVSTITEGRFKTILQSLNYNYSFFGNGLGSSIYEVGINSTITPWPALGAYDLGFLGLFALFILLYLRLIDFSKRDKAIFFTALTYLMINSGYIYIIWVVLILIKADKERESKSSAIGKNTF